MHASYTVKLVINMLVYKTNQTLLVPCMVVNRLPDKGYRGLLLRYVFSEVVTDTRNFYEVTSTCCLFLKCRLQTDCLKSIRRFPLISWKLKKKVKCISRLISHPFLAAHRTWGLELVFNSSAPICSHISINNFGITSSCSAQALQ